MSEAVRARGSQSGLQSGVLTIAYLTALAGLGQIALTIYVPSLPFVAREFQVETGAVQFTLATYLIFFALAQLVCGPIADARGRRPVAIIGLGVFLVATLVCAFASSLSVLVVARAAQALGAAAALIAARAVTRDLFEGPALTRVIAIIAIVFAFLPTLVPMIGGFLQSAAGWRSIFWATLAFGLILFGATVLRLRDVRAPSPGSFGTSGIVADYRSILGDRIAVGQALSIACVFASLTAFFAGSPSLYIEHLGLGPAVFGLHPPIASFGFVIGSAMTGILSSRTGPGTRASLGLLIMAIPLFAMMALPWTDWIHEMTYTALMIAMLAGLGLFLPTAQAAYINRFPDKAGTASAFQGALQMVGGAAGVVAVSAFQGAWPLLAMPAVMAGAVVAGALTLRLVGGADALAERPTVR